MLKIINMAIPSKAILAPTIPYIGAFASLQWSRRPEVGGRRPIYSNFIVYEKNSPKKLSEADVDVRVRINNIKISCGVEVEVVVQASGFACGVSIPVFISLFQFIFFQCLNSRLNGRLICCISDLIVALFLLICSP